MNNKFKMAISLVLIVTVLASAFLVNGFFNHPKQGRPFYVGVEYAYADDTAQLKALVNKFSSYTNLFVIGSLEISFNRTALDESCDYITQSGLSFIVLFTGLDQYTDWPSDYRIMNWMTDAQQRYGNKFLGIYKIDEPGGNQLDNGLSQIINTTGSNSYSQISQSYVGNLSQMNNYYHPYTPSIFTADFALNWFDYKANYSSILAEFVGNESRNRIIAQNRGAAAAFQKDWGVIVNWKYNQPPHYLESGAELYDDLALAYSAGASYGVVFSYPNLTGSAYGILKEEHFEALQRFWNTLQSNPESFGDNTAEVAYVLPADYGFGFRSSSDRVWGLLPDELSSKIYNDITVLTDRYGAKLNILYNEPERITPLLDNYQQVFYWNQTLT